MRFFIIMIANFYCVYERYLNGDPVVYWQNAVLGVFVLILVECVVYTKVKAQAYLFLKIKQVEQQQSQLIGLFDLVPDSVFICTKNNTEAEPKGLFANHKINQFPSQHRKNDILPLF